MELHVVPANDLVDHEPAEACVCGPRPVLVDGGWLQVHHSLDGREDFESVPGA